MTEKRTYKFRGEGLNGVYPNGYLEDPSTTLNVPLEKERGLGSKKIQVSFQMSWPTAMAYMVAVMESHAKKSYFKNGANKLVKEQLMHCADVAELARKKGSK